MADPKYDLNELIESFLEIGSFYEIVMYMTEDMAEKRYRLSFSLYKDLGYYVVEEPSFYNCLQKLFIQIKEDVTRATKEQEGLLKRWEEFLSKVEDM